MSYGEKPSASARKAFFVPTFSCDPPVSAPLATGPASLRCRSLWQAKRSVAHNVSQRKLAGPAASGAGTGIPYKEEDCPCVCPVIFVSLLVFLVRRIILMRIS